MALAGLHAPSNAETRTVSAFDLYAVRKELQTAARLLQAGQATAAETLLEQAIKRGPALPVLHYMRAITQAIQDEPDAAIDSLKSAVAQGFRDADRMQKDKRFALLHDDPRFASLLQEMRTPDPAERFKIFTEIVPEKVSGTTAMVSRTNTQFDPRLGILKSLFRFEENNRPGAVYFGKDKGGADLNKWFSEGRIAGNRGDLYDNRDRNHSRLRRDTLPQLTHLQYSAEAKKANLDYGLNDFFFFDKITIGNASLARTKGPLWRSLPRSVLTEPGGVGRLFLQYANNQLYVYPEHSDHDQRHGDLLPANTPYMIVSQGSSRSDRPFLLAIGATLAAFTPKTKSFLRERRLIMPTVQMILRRSQRFVTSVDDYLEGRTHPSVFVSEQIDLSRMISMAMSLKTEDVPPLPHLQITEETSSQRGVVHFFSPGLSETLFDTPSAIARVFRSTAYTRRLVVSAERTRDPNGRDLTYTWKVLRGDADRISIEPLNEAGSKVAIVVPWHERHPVPGRPELTTDRVDIALFVDNGVHYSSPAFLTFMFPGNQVRKYDDEGKILHVDYRAPELKQRYVDPLLFPGKDWRDTYIYDEQGRLLGWNRLRRGRAASFTRHGAKVVETDSLDRPLKAMLVRYFVKTDEKEFARVVEQETGRFVTYSYSDEHDRLGVMSAMESN